MMLEIGDKVILYDKNSILSWKGIIIEINPDDDPLYTVGFMHEGKPRSMDVTEDSDKNYHIKQIIKPLKRENKLKPLIEWLVK